MAIAYSETQNHMKARLSPDSGSYWDMDSGNSTWNGGLGKYVREFDADLVHRTNCTALLRKEILTDIPTNCEIILTFKIYKNSSLLVTSYSLTNAELNNVIFDTNGDNGCQVHIEMRAPTLITVPKLYWIDIHYYDVPRPIVLYPLLNISNVRDSDDGILVFKMATTNGRGGTLGFGIQLNDGIQIYKRSSHKIFDYQTDIGWGYALTYNEVTNEETTDNSHWATLGTARPSKTGVIGINGAPNTSPLYIRIRLPYYLIGSYNMIITTYNGTQTTESD
jgi:hypothetical protein